MDILRKIYPSICVCIYLMLPNGSVVADGGYFSSRSVAVSADQRAILNKNGEEISMTLSTGYSGNGEDFGWLIPTPVPPSVQDVKEGGEIAEEAFKTLDEYSAPVVTENRGCFPAGTVVHTPDGPRAIESLGVGIEVSAYDFSRSQWTFAKVYKQRTYEYDGDIISIRIGSIELQATGNHVFYVVRGDQLASRPLPPLIPTEDHSLGNPGRWVEARGLLVGDVLRCKSGEDVAITALSRRKERATVYHLEVEGLHNYAVHRTGILVHNGGKGGKGESVSEPEPQVTVYGTMKLAHYEVSVLGAADASALLDWLRDNDYRVSTDARDVLDSYIARNWAFVAVKLNPGEIRVYENEFLPLLTIQYNHDELVFPLHISSIRTTIRADITLYVITSSTVSSVNFPTTNLKYAASLSEPLVPEIHIEGCIQNSLQDDQRGLVVMWAGELHGNSSASQNREALRGLMKRSYRRSQRTYLTRLEGRMDAAVMLEDILFELDPEPQMFSVRIRTDQTVSDSGESGTTPLMMAVVKADDPRQVLKEIENQPKPNIEAQDTIGRTALMYAARYNDNPAFVSELLKAGANINKTDKNGLTPLMMAVAAGNESVIRILLQNEADINAVCSEGESVLIRASRSDAPSEIITLLIEAGADIDAKDKDGKTALMYTAHRGKRDLLELLLQGGADVRQRDNQGATAIKWAAFGGNVENLQVLLDAGADVNTQDHSGWTPIMSSSYLGYVDIVGALIEAGANINLIASDGRTALISATAGGHPEVARLLISAGADVNARAANGMTALIHVVAGKHRYRMGRGAASGYPGKLEAMHDLVNILLSSGADINARDVIGNTALTYAIQNKYDQVMMVLMRAGVEE